MGPFFFSSAGASSTSPPPPPNSGESFVMMEVVMSRLSDLQYVVRSATASSTAFLTSYSKVAAQGAGRPRAVTTNMAEKKGDKHGKMAQPGTRGFKL